MKRALVIAAFACAFVIRAGEPVRAVAAPIPSTSPSATPGPTATPTVKLLDTQIVTAQRHVGTIGSTSRETWVLTACDLLRVGAASIADALRFVPGVTVKNAGTDGSLQTLALRGAKAEQTLVLVNGRPVNEPDTGLVDFSSLPVTGISRIEVVEGGASTLYGSSAIGGVINIITTQPVAASSSAFAQIGIEGATDEGVSVTAGDPSQLSVSIDARSTHSRNQFDYPAFSAIAAGTRTNSYAKITDAALALSRDFGAARVRLRLSDDAQDIGVPGDLSFGATPHGRQQRVYDRSDLTIELPAGRNAWTLQTFADGRRLHIGVPDQPFPFDARDNATSRGFSVRDSLQASASQLVTFGYDSRGNHALFVTGIGQPGTDVADATTAWYVADDLHAPGSPVRASIGIRTERPQGAAATGVPSLGVSDRLNDRVTLRANYARAFRTPDLDDRYFPFSGNPALEPEYAATFDTGAIAEFGRGTLSLTWFGTDTNNLIVLDPVTFLPFNIAKASVRGVDAQLRVALSSDSHARVSFTDYPRAADLSAATGTRLLYRPTATGSAELWRATSHGSAGIDLTFTGRRYANETNTVSLPAYATIGAFVERPIGRGLAVTLRLANLTGQRVQDTYGYPVLGTTFSVRLTTRP